MKKTVFALVVLALAGPASAEVNITAVLEVPGEPNVLISYECTSGEKVLCFGLDIQLDNDETIIAVECLSNDYYLNPQKFTYDGINPSFGVTPCLCAADSGILPGLDSNGITIAMCILYADSDPDHNTPPAAANGLVKLTLSGSCCITITENGKLGGVIDVNNVDIAPTLPGAPVCVELSCECDGDFNRDGFVAFSDVGELVTDLIACGWFCMPGQPCWDVCGDYNGDGFMAFSDVGDLVTYLIYNGWFWDCSGGWF